MRGLFLPCSIMMGLTLGSCTAPAADSTGDDAAAAAAAEAALRSTFDELIAAYESEDVPAITALYADDIVIIPPGEAVVDDRAVQMEGLNELLESDYSIEAEIRDLQMSGDLAVTFVSYTDSTTPRDGGEATESAGRWAIVWTRGADGQWRVSREIWNLAPEESAGD